MFLFVYKSEIRIQCKQYSIIDKIMFMGKLAMVSCGEMIKP